MEQVSKYFNAEKAESILFIAAGLIAIIVSAYFFIRLKQPFYNGLAYSLIVIALIQLTVGISIYYRSPKDISRVNQIIQTDKAKIKTKEIPRMKTVMKNFVLYRWIEISLIIIGIIMFLFLGPGTIWRGVGLGLFIQAGLMLLFDYFAESRGTIYLEYLQNLN